MPESSDNTVRVVVLFPKDLADELAEAVADQPFGYDRSKLIRRYVSDRLRARRRRIERNGVRATA